MISVFSINKKCDSKPMSIPLIFRAYKIISCRSVQNVQKLIKHLVCTKKVEPHFGNYLWALWALMPQFAEIVRSYNTTTTNRYKHLVKRASSDPKSLVSCITQINWLDTTIQGFTITFREGKIRIKITKTRPLWYCRVCHCYTISSDASISPFPCPHSSPPLSIASMG